MTPWGNAIADIEKRKTLKIPKRASFFTNISIAMISSVKKLLCKVMKNSLETKCDAIHLAGPSAAGTYSWLVFFCEFCRIFVGIAVTSLW